MLPRALLFAMLIAAACSAENPKPRKDEARATMALLAGRWKSELNADTLVVDADGHYHWGRPYTGRFSVQRNGRIIMSLRENGKLLGGMPLILTTSGDTVRLTPVDYSAQMAFYRVVEER